MSDRRYVRYGCGIAAPEGWINFNSSPRLRFERMPSSELLGIVAIRNSAAGGF